MLRFQEHGNVHPGMSKGQQIRFVRHDNELHAMYRFPAFPNEQVSPICANFGASDPIADVDVVVENQAQDVSWQIVDAHFVGLSSGQDGNRHFAGHGIGTGLFIHRFPEI